MAFLTIPTGVSGFLCLEIKSRAILICSTLPDDFGLYMQITKSAIAADSILFWNDFPGRKEIR